MDAEESSRWKRLRAGANKLAGRARHASLGVGHKSRELTSMTKEKVTAGSEHAWHTTKAVARQGWDKTTDGSEDAWEWTKKTSGNVLTWTNEVSGDGARWMKTNAPAAWRAAQEGGSRVVRTVAEHDDEIKAALTLIVEKTTKATELVMEYDDEIMAATAVLAVFQPQLLLVAAGYEAGKPAIKALTKLANRYRDKKNAADMTKDDWKAIAQLSGQLKKGRSS